MQRRQVLNVLLALTALRMIPLTVEQARAQTAKEIEDLLRSAYLEQEGKYAPFVIQHPTAVAQMMEMPLSADSVKILTSINEAIEPVLRHYVKDQLNFDLPVYDPGAIDYYKMVLETGSFNTDWYSDVSARARELGIEIKPSTASAISDMAEKAISHDALKQHNYQAGAGGIVIVGVIVVVIAFGPRGRAEAIARELDVDYKIPTPEAPCPYTPVIDPRVFLKY